MAKVLIIEDDPLMSRMYQKIFKFEGYEVEMAGGGDDEEGLKKAKDTKPILILLDVMMPKINGLQVLEKLKLDNDTKAYACGYAYESCGTTRRRDCSIKRGWQGFDIH